MPSFTSSFSVATETRPAQRAPVTPSGHGPSRSAHAAPPAAAAQECPAPQHSTARLLAGPWGRTWLLAVALGIAALGTWEVYWRKQGFEPSRVSDEALWVLAREKLAARQQPIALIGASRSAVGLDLDVFTACTGVPPIQLSIYDSSPTPILHELAEDDAFRGLVICDVTPRLFFQASGPALDRTRPYLRRYLQYSSPAERCEWSLQLALEATLVCRLERLSPEFLAECCMKGSAPARNLGTVRADRMTVAHYPPNYARDRVRKTGPFKRNPYLVDAAGRDALLARVAKDVQRIRARGGEVVFIALPESGEALEKDRQDTPREDFWDVLLARTGAIGLHFEDVPGMNGYECPDGSHLDSRDAPHFTRAVLNALQPQLAGTPWQFPPGANAAGMTARAAR